VKRRPCHSGSLFWAAAVAAVVAIASPGRADPIDAVLVQDAPALCDLVAKKYSGKNVAVLKFQVKLGDAKESFDVGTMGADMVRRLEKVFLLTLDANKPQFTLLSDTGKVIAKKSITSKIALDWTTTEHRKVLFDLKYKPNWSTVQSETPKDMHADVFLTGIVCVSADYKEISEIKLFAFEPGKKDSVWITNIKMSFEGKGKGIPIDRRTLASLGRSFSVDSRALGGGPGLDSAAEKAAEQVADLEKANMKPSDFKSKVRLEVLFDGQSTPWQADDRVKGNFKVGGRLDSARKDQKVTFRLTNTTDETLGVLLCVNGENTVALDADKLTNPLKPRSKYRMWLLTPNRTVTVDGFLTEIKPGESRWKDIVVLGDVDSVAQYNVLSEEHAGRIQMEVYNKMNTVTTVTPGNGGTGVDKEDANNKKEKLNSGIDDADLNRNEPEQPRANSRSLGAVQSDLKLHLGVEVDPKSRSVKVVGPGDKPKTNVDSRGLFAPAKDEKSGGEVKTEPFVPNDQPVESVAIRYYQPK